MLHMWHWKWLLWYYTTWLWDTHFRWAQSGQLHVSVPPLCHSVYMYVCKWANINMQVFYRFFLMYLINKDETEHTGQVSLIRFITVFFFFLLLLRFPLTENRICYFQCLVPCCIRLWNLVLTSSVLGVIRLEDVPGALLGLLPCWRLFQKAIWGSAFLADRFFTHTEGKWQLLNFLCSSFLTKLHWKKKKDFVMKNAK